MGRRRDRQVPRRLAPRRCACGDCAHPGGQRLLDSATIPTDIDLVAAELDGDAVEIAWSDGHRGRFDAAWLRRYAAAPARRSPEPWPDHLRPRRSDADVVASDAALRDWLAAVADYGFAVLRGVPAEPGQVTRVAELFGHVRETNYGRLFDVRSVVNPSNLAYTGLGSVVHTDNPYRDPTPTLQLLHCLSSSARAATARCRRLRGAEALRVRQPDAVRPARAHTDPVPLPRRRHRARRPRYR